MWLVLRFFKTYNKVFSNVDFFSYPVLLGGEQALISGWFSESPTWSYSNRVFKKNWDFWKKINWNLEFIFSLVNTMGGQVSAIPQKMDILWILVVHTIVLYWAPTWVRSEWVTFSDEHWANFEYSYPVGPLHTQSHRPVSCGPQDLVRSYVWTCVFHNDDISRSCHFSNSNYIDRNLSLCELIWSFCNYS